MTILLVSPNWLGDAVMALPAAADVRRHERTARLAVAARASVAGLWSLAAGVDEVVTLPHGRGLDRWRSIREGAERLRSVRADAALLLPNSLQSALPARRAGVPERWGYRRGLRGPLLTRAVPAPRPRAPGQAPLEVISIKCPLLYWVFSLIVNLRIFIPLAMRLEMEPVWPF